MTHFFFKKKHGSSLLVAILVMGILSTLTLGLSNLVIYEISQTSNIVASGKAYFAAEAGVENALFDLQEHLPGYETANNVQADKDGWVSYQDTSSDFHYRYRIRNKGDKYPYFDADEPVFLQPGIGISRDTLYEQHPQKTYNVLRLNDTVTIPLFVEGKDGQVHDIRKFLIQYYVDFESDPDIDILGFKNLKLENFDILRWKVTGAPLNPPDTGKTEVISDYFPAHTEDSAVNPVCIGSSSDFGEDWVRCLKPQAKYVSDEGVDLNDEPFFDELWSQARECYLNDAGSIVTGAPDSGEVNKIKKGCSIETFVNNHTRNYITLTNDVNPDIIGISDPVKRSSKANIYYRIIARDDTLSGTADKEKVLVREFADISADGFASQDKVKQSVDVQLKLTGFLPVFNFSLYRTDTDSGTSIESPQHTVDKESKIGL